MTHIFCNSKLLLESRQSRNFTPFLRAQPYYYYIKTPYLCLGSGGNYKNKSKRVLPSDRRKLSLFSPSFSKRFNRTYVRLMRDIRPRLAPKDGRLQLLDKTLPEILFFRNFVTFSSEVVSSNLLNNIFTNVF